ncbi:hypothetical protein Q3G72_033456 [Acer saccharum]|nr:hypothetical protein Q3G72_033456 [Acer saccharum]
MDLLLHCFNKWDGDVVGLFCVVLWRTWFNRNHVVHGFTWLQLNEVVDWSQSFVTGYRRANVVDVGADRQVGRIFGWNPATMARFVVCGLIAFESERVLRSGFDNKDSLWL